MRKLTEIKMFFVLVCVSAAFVNADVVTYDFDCGNLQGCKVAEDIITLSTASDSNSSTAICSGKHTAKKADLADCNTPFQTIYAEFLNSNSNNVQVIAHRGDWRNVPENSLSSIRNCIKMGADIVEIDIRRTKDRHLILMHDSTVNRTTNGTGKVSELTLKQIRALRLKKSDKTITDIQVPTLEEAMLLAKGKIMVNLDKAWGIRNECIEILKKTDTINHAVFKAKGDPLELKKQIEALKVDINFIHIVFCRGTDKSSAESILGMVEVLKPKAIEICFDDDNDPIMLPENIKKIRQQGTRFWVNSLWGGSLSGGHPDSNTDTWDWMIARGVNMIQTDSAHMLRKHLDNLKKD